MVSDTATLCNPMSEDALRAFIEAARARVHVPTHGARSGTFRRRVRATKGPPRAAGTFFAEVCSSAEMPCPCAHLSV
jgi:hypothetical protein